VYCLGTDYYNRNASATIESTYRKFGDGKAVDREAKWKVFREHPTHEYCMKLKQT